VVKRKRKQKRRIVRRPMNRLLGTVVDATRIGVVAGVGFGVVKGVNNAF